MPRPGPRRPVVALRLSAQGVAHIDDLARAAGLMVNVRGKDGAQPNRSEMARIMLTYASMYMPPGWEPPRSP
jgi:hypothetical protein